MWSGGTQRAIDKIMPAGRNGGCLQNPFVGGESDHRDWLLSLNVVSNKPNHHHSFLLWLVRFVAALLEGVDKGNL